MSLSLERLRADGVLLPVGLNLAGMDLTRDDYEALGFMLGAMHETLKWAIGDYLREGERRYGEEAYQLQEALGISAESKKQYVRVAERIPLPRRRSELSWSHHRSVSALEPAEQDSWLERAIQNDWSRADLDAHRNPEENGKTQVLCEEVIRAAIAVVDAEAGENREVWMDAMSGLREALGRGTDA